MSAVAARAELASHAERETTRLFEAHSGEILRYCRRHLPSQAEPEDALQTTFLYALRGLRRGVEPECPAAWLTAIAKNVCLTERRTLGRRGRATGAVDLDRIALAAPDPDEVGLLATLRTALAALPATQRSAIVMREWQGLGASEIAERLELAPTAASALLTRARNSLATALTTAGRTRSALNVSVLLGVVRSQLRVLLGCASGKVVVGAAIATVAVGGVAVERSLDAPAHPSIAPTRVSELPRAERDASVRPTTSKGRLRATGSITHSRSAPVSTSRTSRVGTGTRAVAAPQLPLAPARGEPTPTTPSVVPPGDPGDPVDPVLPTTPSALPTPTVPSPPVQALPTPPTVDLPALPELPAPSGSPVDDPQVPPLPTLP